MPRDPKKGKAAGKAGKGKKKGDDDDEVFFKSKTLQKVSKDAEAKAGKGAKGGKAGKGGKRVIQAKSAAEAQQKVAAARKKATERKAQKKQYANFDELSDDEDEEEVAKRLARDAARADRMGISKGDDGVVKSEKRAKKEAVCASHCLTSLLLSFITSALSLSLSRSTLLCVCVSLSLFLASATRIGTRPLPCYDAKRVWGTLSSHGS